MSDQPGSRANDAHRDDRPVPPHADAATDEVDMSLIELNLKKTPWQRLKDHDEALGLIQALRKAAGAGE